MQWPTRWRAKPTSLCLNRVITLADTRTQWTSPCRVRTARATALASGRAAQEFAVGEAFRLQGYQVTENHAGGTDGGIDLILRKGNEKFLVQCKQWKAFTVAVTIVRELYGVMAAERAVGGFVVTSGQFTKDAEAFAKTVIRVSCNSSLDAMSCGSHGINIYLDVMLKGLRDTENRGYYDIISLVYN